MRSEMLEKFVAYAKEQFDCDIRVVKANGSDVFTEVFGGSFMNSQDEIYLPDGKESDYIRSYLSGQENLSSGISKYDLVDAEVNYSIGIEGSLLWHVGRKNDSESISLTQKSGDIFAGNGVSETMDKRCDTFEGIRETYNCTNLIDAA